MSRGIRTHDYSNHVQWHALQPNRHLKCTEIGSIKREKCAFVVEFCEICRKLGKCGICCGRVTASSWGTGTKTQRPQDANPRRRILVCVKGNVGGTQGGRGGGEKCSYLSTLLSRSYVHDRFLGGGGLEKSQLMLFRQGLLNSACEVYVIIVGVVIVRSDLYNHAWKREFESLVYSFAG